jgi:hypothetical protein
MAALARRKGNAVNLANYFQYALTLRARCPVKMDDLPRRRREYRKRLKL